jgi:hypothetical protein
LQHEIRGFPRDGGETRQTVVVPAGVQQTRDNHPWPIANSNCFEPFPGAIPGMVLIPSFFHCRFSGLEDFEHVADFQTIPWLHTD